MNEYTVWGITPGDDDERILFGSDPRNGHPITDRDVADRLACLAERRGALSVRVASLDTEPPSFAESIQLNGLH